MSFDFLVPIQTYPDPTAKAGLGRALDMAASITGKLSVLVHEVDIPPLHNLIAEALIGVSAMAAEAEERSRLAGRDLAAEVQHLAHRLMLPAAVRTLRTVPARLEDEMVAAARQHDATLFILDPDAVGQTELAEAILFGSGGPILVCPAAEAPGHLYSVVVAWDGGRAAARALRDALPVLKMATSVTILIAAGDKPIDPAGVAGARALLQYHGVSVEERSIPTSGLRIGEALQSAALEAGAGLLVMGAYGHSRLREFALGGATESALHRPMMPIFMSH